MSFSPFLAFPPAGWGREEVEISRKTGRGRSLWNEWENHWRVHKLAVRGGNRIWDSGGKKYHKPDHLPISAEKEIVHLCFVLLCFGAWGQSKNSEVLTVFVFLIGQLKINYAEKQEVYHRWVYEDPLLVVISESFFSSFIVREQWRTQWEICYQKSVCDVGGRVGGLWSKTQGQRDFPKSLKASWCRRRY